MMNKIQKARRLRRRAIKEQNKNNKLSFSEAIRLVKANDAKAEEDK